MKIGTTEVDTSGMDVTSATETLETVRRFWRDFPDAAGALARVYVGGWPDISPDPQRWPDAETFKEDGLTSPGVGGILPGDRYTVRMSSWEFGPGNRPNLLQICEQAKDMHPVATPQSVLEHELGHVLDLYASQRAGSSLPLSFERIEEFDALITSPYALAGPHETFAEAFSGWWDPAHVVPISSNVRKCIRDAAYVGGWQR